MTNRSEIESLTWLRGLAALSVVVSHSMQALNVRYHPADELPGFGALHILSLGSLGVALFFVLSGCTLTLSNSELSISSRQALTGFYAKRFLRIWPAYAVALLAYLTFTPLFRSLYGQQLGHWVENQFFTPASLTDLMMYMGLVFNITGPPELYNNAFWSLPVEFQYYLMFPLFLLSIRVLSIFGPVLIAGILFFVGRSGILPLDSNLVLVLGFTFAAGMVLGHVYTRWSFRLSRAPALLMITAITALASLMSNDIVPIEVYRFIPSEWVFYGLCGVALVSILLFSNIQLPDPFRKPALYLGKISYSLYLYHNLLIAVSVLGLIHYEIQGDWTRTLWVCSWAFGGSLALAAISYRWIEEPAIRFGKRMNRAKLNRSQDGLAPTPSKTR
ncbi:acyltransferase family protein [Marinobacter salsuginis]|nr:acyltransferase [Marinobacter salsuginis]